MLKRIGLSALVLCCSIQVALAQRIVVLSPDVAEVVVALGSANEVQGKDQFDPAPELKNVPVVGMHRAISPEPIVAVKPDIVLGSYMVQPASIFDNLNKLNVKAVNVSPKENTTSYIEGIHTIGKLINKEKEASILANQWQNNMKALPKTGKRYILSYDGRFVEGHGTVGDKLIELAGGVNAVGDVEGLKPLSREGWLSANPDIIIIASHNAHLINGVDNFAKRLEIMNSPAAKNKQIYLWPVNDYMRYGLHSPEVIKKLNQLASK